MAAKIKIKIEKREFKEDFMVEKVPTKPVHFKLSEEEHKELTRLANRYKFPKPGRFAKKMVLGWLSTQKG